MDVEDPISGNYTLEVSSPGVDRPLFNLEQFGRHLGEMAKVTLKLPQDNRRRLQGRSEATDEAADTITFVVDKTEVVVSADNIDKARIMPDWVALGLAPSKPTGPAPKRPKPNKNSSSNEPAAKKPRADDLRCHRGRPGLGGEEALSRRGSADPRGHRPQGWQLRNLPPLGSGGR
ncbi:hypothetical protein G6F59_014785 [Rhizopus arrhizus]|nr:hypothetical protein G6F59_014785 [Rhizopus arrhizus]